MTNLLLLTFSNKTNFLIICCAFGGARGVVVIAVGNGHGDTSSNPGFEIILGKGMNPIILPPAMGK